MRPWRHDRPGRLSVTNPTALNFGYPRTLVAQTDHWLVLVRPKQPTLGSLVLVCKDKADALSGLTPAAFTDMGVAVRAIEAMLKAVVGYAKINYLALMMVDPDVHFHVIPRYEGERIYEGRAFPDAGWPGQPALNDCVTLDIEQAEGLADDLRKHWAAR